MTETPDTIRRALGAWVAVEVFTPQVAKPTWDALAVEWGGRQRNKGMAAPDGPAHWEVPGDGDLTPWPQRPDPPPEPAPAGPDVPRRWYAVVLGALPAVAPSWFARVFKTRAWRAHVAGVREQVDRLGRVQDAGRAAGLGRRGSA